MPSATLERELGLLEADVQRMLDQIERFLEQQPRPVGGITLPPLEELERQAGIIRGPAWRQPKKRRRRAERVLPGKLRAMLPEQLHRRRAVQHVSVARHLELTLEVLERYGWAKTGTCWRTVGGRRCILGAQMLLLSLGYGDRDTMRQAGGYLNHQLRSRGVSQGYEEWNENVRRDWGDVKHLMQRAIADAQKARA